MIQYHCVALRVELPKLDHFDFEVTVLSRICIKFKVKYIIGKGLHLAVYVQNLEAKEALEQRGEKYEDKNPRSVQLRSRTPSWTTGS